MILCSKEIIDFTGGQYNTVSRSATAFRPSSQASPDTLSVLLVKLSLRQKAMPPEDNNVVFILMGNCIRICGWISQAHYTYLNKGAADEPEFYTPSVCRRY